MLPKTFWPLRSKALTVSVYSLPVGWPGGTVVPARAMRSMPAKRALAVPCFRARRSALRARPKRTASLFACVAFPAAVGGVAERDAVAGDQGEDRRWAAQGRGGDACGGGDALRAGTADVSCGERNERCEETDSRCRLPHRDVPPRTSNRVVVARRRR